jgi:anti-sigma factor RsiW
MKHDDFQELMDLARRRPLTPSERSRLDRFMEADPQAWPDREEDMALVGLMARLPDAPLASNFSARVMEAIGLEERRVKRENNPLSLHWWAHSWWARLGVASCAVLIAVGAWYQHQLTERADRAESVATISEAAAILSVEILKDSDIIQLFGKVPPVADMETDLHLLAALE